MYCKVSKTTWSSTKKSHPPSGMKVPVVAAKNFGPVDEDRHEARIVWREKRWALPSHKTATLHIQQLKGQWPIFTVNMQRKPPED